MMPSHDVEPGDRPSAENINAIRAEANKALGGEGQVSGDADGIQMAGPSGEVLELYEITVDSALDEEWQQHKGMGKPVSLSYSPTRFTMQGSQKEEPLWLPTDVQVDDVGQGTTPVFVGERVWTILWLDKRCIVGGAGGGSSQPLRWAKIYSFYNNKTQYYSGTPDDAIAQPCDKDGKVTDIQTIQLVVPKKGNLDPSLFIDDVVGWLYDDAGYRVIVTNCTDDPFFIVKWESVDVNNIRKGWRLCTGKNGTPDLRGRFILGLDQEGSEIWNENDIGDTGGTREHTHDAHPDHRHKPFETESSIDGVGGSSYPAATGNTSTDDGHFHTVAIAYGEYWIGDSEESRWTQGAENLAGEYDNLFTHSVVDHRPRYYVMAPIQRNY